MSPEQLERRTLLDSTVVFSEIMYNPLDDPNDRLEWIELYNQLSVDMDISEWRIEGGIEFEFPTGTIVKGRDYLVVATDPEALEASAGFSESLGPFSGRLSNSGEELRLYNNDERRMNVVEYGDNGEWPVEPDGGGPSLAKRSPLSSSEDAGNWTYSAELGGTPGTANVAVSESLQLNEIAEADGESFFIEITNDATVPRDVGGHVLTTTGDNGGDYVLPAQVLPAGGRLVVDQDQLGGRPADGERVFLYAPNKDRLIDGRAVTNSLRGRSSSHDKQWLWPDVASPGDPNVFSFHDQIVINEIMYHAPPTLRSGNTPYAESGEEWIELFNRGDQSVDLSGWRLRDAIEYEFPNDTTIAPGAYLVVAKDAEAIKTKYGIANVVGDFSGTLGNQDDRISLVDANKNPADEVHYYERGRWAEFADGGGSSLELRDPLADNSKGEAWAASDQMSDSEWTDYVFTDRADEPLGCCTGFNEWVFGLLDAGEFLLDDVSLIRSGTNTQLIQNGSFESDAIGSQPDSWRFVGNHDGTVIVDPDDPSNHVVHVAASGAQALVSDYVSTTFVNNTSVRSSSNYTIRFRAKWLTGNRQLNNRLYLTRMSNTAILDAPDNHGTPGKRNSTTEANLGPTYDQLAHDPVMPRSGQSVTVTVRAEDVHAVTSLTLWYRANSGTWRNVPMTADGDGIHSGSIPGHSSGTVVQFYVEGTDSLDATSTFPARGRDSRALYEVTSESTRNVDTLRFILTPGDRSVVVPTTTGRDARNMSNKYGGTTLIRNGSEVFYDVEVRQIGSRWIRPNSGFKIRLNPDQKFNGVHDSLRFDINGLKEIIFKQLVNRAGGSSVSLYDDIAYMESPFQDSRMLLGLARYDSVYLDEQFKDGGDGTIWELDDITYPINASPRPEGEKRGSDSAAVSTQDMEDRGDNPEDYRGQLLIKNNRAKDDFEAIVRLTDAINKSGTALYNATNEAMDVDLWMRHYATQAFLGNWDTYGFGRAKNLRVYTRPEDGKLIPLFWDADLANLTEPLIYNGSSSRLDEIRNIPVNERLFWGHMLDLVNRSFNVDYAQFWATHYNSLGAGTSSEASRIANRATQARNQAMSAIPVVPFAITSNGGEPLTTNQSLVTLEGTGWIDVRLIRDADTGEELEVVWTDEDSWEVKVPVDRGANTVRLMAIDFAGHELATDTIQVTSTATELPLRDVLRISEIHYNPAGSDDSEFIELLNVASAGSTPLDLSGVQFTEGITFDFSASAVTSLAPGDRVLVVKDTSVFESIYGAGLPIAGIFAGSLANEGESITLRDADNAVIHRFEYQDDWYSLTDGDGFTLTIVDPTQDVEQWDAESGWRPSERIAGSPGTGDNGIVPGSIVINEVSNNSNDATGNWIELRNTTDTDIDVSGWYLSDSALTQKKFPLPPGTTIPAGQYLVLTEVHDFGNPAGEQPFALSELGGQLHLRSADGDGELTGYQDSRSFGAADMNLTQGLTVTSDGYVFAVLVRATRGSDNAAPTVGPVVINEIMYNAAVGGVDFVELKNITDSSISLNDGNENVWEFNRGIQFQLPIGAILAPNGFAVVIEGSAGGDLNQEANEFRTNYDVPADIPIFVYNRTDNGVLDNGGENLAIARRSQSGAGNVIVDRINYDDSVPWPTAADGDGSSLSKVESGQFGNDPARWAVGSLHGTPGRDNLFLDTTPPSDPQDLRGRIIPGGEIALAWAPSSDDQTGISHYNIYLDNELTGTAEIPWLTTRIAFDAASQVTYEVTAVNGDGAESGRSAAFLVGAESDSFQSGANGYDGAADSEMREGDANSNNGRTDQSLEVDGEDGGTELAVLLRWQDLSIPAGSRIVGANFTVNITNTGNQYNVERVLRAWNESEVTWNQASNGVPWQVSGGKGNTDHGPLVAEFGANTTPFNAVGVAMVQSWIDEPASNHGILLSNPGGATDGVDFDSREVSSVSNRPKLTILYLPAEQPLVLGDFTLDGTVDAKDITSMCHAIRAGSREPVFDLAEDSGPAGQADLDVLINNILNTNYGDANLDGIFNSGDLVQVFVAGEYEDGIPHNSTWGEGDWDCDGDFGTSDLIVAFAAGAYVTNARASQQVDLEQPIAALGERPTDLQKMAAAADRLWQGQSSGPIRRASNSGALTRQRNVPSGPADVTQTEATLAAYARVVDRFYSLGLEARNEVDDSPVDKAISDVLTEPIDGVSVDAVIAERFGN